MLCDIHLTGTLIPGRSRSEPLSGEYARGICLSGENCRRSGEKDLPWSAIWGYEMHGDKLCGSKSQDISAHQSVAVRSHDQKGDGEGTGSCLDHSANLGDRDLARRMAGLDVRRGQADSLETRVTV